MEKEVYGYYWVYMSCKDKAEALHIGRALVLERLAACVHIMEGVTSLYEWEGKFCKETEAVLIAKTTEGQVDALMAEGKRLHSYETPAILALPISKGEEDYLAWMRQQTKSGG